MQNAAIYDMDGLLVDSEPIWQEAEINVFAHLGVKLTREMCYLTKGLRIDEVIDYWYDRFPWDNYNRAEVMNDVMDEVIRLFGAKGQLLPGSEASIQCFKSAGFKLAVASSSHIRVINGVLNKFDLKSNMDIVWSAQFESHGKPHPAIYLTASSLLQCPPSHCVALEDSIHGVVAAVSARMKVIAVPEARDAKDPKFAIANARLDSLDGVNSELISSLF